MVTQPSGIHEVHDSIPCRGSIWASQIFKSVVQRLPIYRLADVVDIERIDRFLFKLGLAWGGKEGVQSVLIPSRIDRPRIVLN